MISTILNHLTNNLSSLGLAIIALAWGVQFVKMKNKKEIEVTFLLINALGICLIIIDSYKTDLVSVAFFNTLGAIANLFVLHKLVRIKRK